MATQDIACSESRRNYPLQVKSGSDVAREIDAEFEPDFEPRTPSGARDAGSMPFPEASENRALTGAMLASQTAAEDAQENAEHLCRIQRWAAAQKLPLAQYGVLNAFCSMLDEHAHFIGDKKTIAAQLHLTDRQVHTILGKLAAAGILIVDKLKRGGRGRPSNYYALDFAYVLHEIHFQKPNCGSSIHEASFQKSVFMKPEVGSQLPKIASKNPEPGDNSGAHIEHAPAGGNTNLKTTATSLIRSDQIMVADKAMIESLIERAGAACDPTAPGVHHGADLNRLLRGGCLWDDDILPAVDKLAASFARRGQRFRTWDLLVEHATEFRDRRLQGIPAPKPREAPPKPAVRNGIRRNIYMGDRCAV